MSGFRFATLLAHHLCLSTSVAVAENLQPSYSPASDEEVIRELGNEAEFRPELARSTQVANEANMRHQSPEHNAAQSYALQRRDRSPTLTTDTVWRWAKIIFWGAILLWLWSKRASIVRAWYFFTPHPAQRFVEDATSGQPLDIEGFKRALHTDPANKVERAVRQEQMHEAIRQLREHKSILDQEAAASDARERQLATELAQAERVYRMGLIEKELLKAALEHQASAARAEALRNRES